MTPFEKRIKRFEAARAEARKAIRDAEARALVASAPEARTPRLFKLQNAIIEVKKQRAAALASNMHLLRHGHQDHPDESPLVTAQQHLQQAFVGEITAALAKLEALCDEIRWNKVHTRADRRIAKARAALARARATADRVAALPIKRVARQRDKLTAALKHALEAAKLAVAATMVDEETFEATQTAMQNLGRLPRYEVPPHPPDAAIVARAVAAQKVAVDDLKKQLYAVLDAMKTIVQSARIKVASRRSS